MGVAPGGQLAGGFAHHVGAERAHQAHLFAKRQELVGRQQAAPGMTPADQGLEARERAGREAHDRLVIGHQFAAADGAAQVALQGQARQAVAFQAAAIGGRPAAAAGLGRLNGEFGPPQQLGGFRRLIAALGPHRAHREGRMDVEAGHPKGPLQGVAQDLAGGRLAHRRQHAEFVFADAGQQHAWPEGGGQPRPEGRQDQVGALMPQGLVQPAQAIEIGHHQLVIARMLQVLAGAQDEALAVQQAREVVEIGRGELGLGGDHAGGADALLQPDSPPDADPAASHAQAHGHLRARLLHPQHIVSAGAVLGQGQGAHGGRRAFRGQRTQAKGARGSGEAELIALRLPMPQGHIGRAQRFQCGGGVPDPTVARHGLSRPARAG